MRNPNHDKPGWKERLHDWASNPSPVATAYLSGLATGLSLASLIITTIRIICGI